MMKDIEGFEGRYAITDEGQVWSYYLNDFMSLKPNDKGYIYATLRKNGSQKRIAVHRLVAQAFIDNPNNLPEVNHKDEDKTNNNVSNLEWCTREYNVNYGTAIERSTEAQRQYHPTQRAVLCIETGVIYHSAQEASRQTGINNTSISKVCNGKRNIAGGFHWKFVD